MKNTELLEKTVSSSLSPSLHSLPISVFDSLDSTNTEAKRRLSDGAGEPFAVLALTQTAGHGRLGRSFYSPAGTGLYLSVALPHFAPEKALFLTTAASVAVCRAAEENGCEKPLKIKWVNDILDGTRKVCGILAEAVSIGQSVGVVLGVGINIAESAFPPDLAEVAGSLGLSPSCLPCLAASFLNAFMPLAENPDPALFMEDYRRRSAVLGQSVRYWQNGEEHRADAVAIADDGALLVAEAGKTVRLATGEISLRLTGISVPPKGVTP